jgi:hypothetical protein
MYDEIILTIDDTPRNANLVASVPRMYGSDNEATRVRLGTWHRAAYNWSMRIEIDR